MDLSNASMLGHMANSVMNAGNGNTSFRQSDMHNISGIRHSNNNLRDRSMNLDMSGDMSRYQYDRS
jgi:hypothetical protein